MGNGSTKNQKNVQQVNVPTSLPTIETVQPSSLQYVWKNQTPPQSPAHSIPTRPSTKQSVKQITNGSPSHTPSLQLNTDSKRQESDQISLPSIHSQYRKSASRYSVRTSSVVRPPPISRTRLSQSSLNRSHSIAPEKPVGRCAFCPHCKENTSEKCLTDPPPKWIVGEPKERIVTIDMIEYDTVAVRKKILPKNGHLRGEYDYEPQLTIERIDEKNENTGRYFTQTLVAKTEPTISPTRTPFPDYDLLQLRDYHSNGIYSLPSYDQ